MSKNKNNEKNKEMENQPDDEMHQEDAGNEKDGDGDGTGHRPDDRVRQDAECPPGAVLYPDPVPGDGRLGPEQAPDLRQQLGELHGYSGCTARHADWSPVSVLKPAAGSFLEKAPSLGGFLVYVDRASFSRE